MQSFKRKSPEEILKSIYELHRGRLKVYVGAVNGSGKTYHMLREGQMLKAEGIDVVICAVSTLQRPETVEQLAGLERVPSIHWKQDGMEKKDLNLDALVRRNPEVVLVDGLAHANREGASFPTRLEDIHYLLGHGISIITTVNIYELRGMTELVQKLIGIDVKDTVPEGTLELADEVRLIDVSPETLLQRLAAGHLRNIPDKAVFNRGNLGVLRELALRWMAEGVNDTLEKHREEQGLIGAAGVAERILVSAQYHWNGSIYVRRGQQIARRLNGDMLVVTFVNPRRKLSPEAATFKRSLTQLSEKVGAKFAELPLPTRRMLPQALVRYALEHRVTRIVLGHSKQTRMQELWQGSIVGDILKQTKNVDIFVVADRAETEGERILPAKTREEHGAAEPYRRLSEAEVEQQIGRIRRGRFKVYIGAAPGVGKTYTMLREGNDLRKKGIDVRIGLLETHGRDETTAQVGALPSFSRAVLDYRGTQLEEMDTASILARNPEVVLVDELAHTNMPGSKHKKRYEDVLEILEAGISVISTMNIQHLESLNDAVEQITGVRVRETVPDFILRQADEVELIDVAPKALQQRMREGKIYAMDKVDQALGNFFKTGNLIALRELALRELADDVDERLESWQRRSPLRGGANREEMIFVGVTLSSGAERLIRRGFRIAYRLKASWHVFYRHNGSGFTPQEQERLQAIERLTRRLGGTFEMQKGPRTRKLGEALVRKADELGSTQMILGQSGRNRWQRLWRGDVVSLLLRQARYMDILVVADFDPSAQIKKEGIFFSTE
ncbi:histidine kinase [Paenibacillus sp. DXFW5]|uniref:Histidine kinase n=1 Tax=Paenibacillus rhizolycopersici TaxID=2780073 RepID=A0ABS2H7T2_9BACL|nr:histidine kinase [Paenibacillus rhizolycopersici]MBM6996044.1 histidine kinase [Paenibacillus rhizolycopersici]